MFVEDSRFFPIDKIFTVII